MAFDIFEGKTISDIIILQSVRSCSPTATVGDVVTILQTYKIGAVVIVDEKKVPIGIFTERDLLTKIYAKSTASSDDLISKHMTKGPKCLKSDDRIEKAIVSMRIGGFRHIVITDSVGVLTGMLSVKDILNCIVDFISEKTA